MINASTGQESGSIYQYNEYEIVVDKNFQKLNLYF